MKEEGKDSMDTLKSGIGEDLDAGTIDELLSEDLVRLTDDNGRIVPTKKGEDDAR